MDFIKQQKIMIITSISEQLFKIRGYNLTVSEFDAVYDAKIQDLIHEYNVLVTLNLRKRINIAQSL
jgi:hypothetical protein